MIDSWIIMKKMLSRKRKERIDHKAMMRRVKDKETKRKWTE